MDNKHTYLIIALTVVIAGVVFWGTRQPDSKIEEKSSSTTDVIVYYYGETCPHCQDVAKFLEENKIADKVDFTKKEVWNNAGHNAEMQKRVGECGLNKSEVGVPFLYARGECLIGTPAVTGFFKKAAGME